MSRALVLAASLAAAAAAQTAPPSPSVPVPDVQERQSVEVRREAERAFAAMLPRVAPLLVRVRMSYETQIASVDGGTVPRVMEQGWALGLVVDPLPIVLVSASANRVEQAANVALGTPPIDESRLRYELVLQDGTAVATEPIDRDRALNLVLLRLADRAAEPPRELHATLALDGMHRPQPKDFYGIFKLENAATSAKAVFTPGRLKTASAAYARPAVTAAGLGDLGAPVFTADGAFAGIINLTPPEDGLPVLAMRKPDVTEAPGRDPLEYSTGFRRPVLMTCDEMGPRIAKIREQVAAPVAIDALGLTLRNAGGGVSVVAVASDAPARLDPPLRADDRIVGVGGDDVSTIESLQAALERAFAAGGADPVLRVARGEASLAVRVTGP